VFTLEEAQAFRTRFFKAYPSIWAWQHQTPVDPITTVSIYGRRRADVSVYTEKLASPIQSAEADLLKNTLARLWADRAAGPSAIPVNVVHDSVLMECDEVEADTVKAWLIRHMEAAGAAMLPDVPVKAGAVIKRDWCVK
jgi:DNA polymerase I-like protein with 3'-5' exonuclease and polymerase domains